MIFKYEGILWLILCEVLFKGIDFYSSSVRGFIWLEVFLYGGGESGSRGSNKKIIKFFFECCWVFLLM